MYGPEMINCMVLKYIRLSSGDQIPVHKNTLSFSIKVVRFFDCMFGNI